MSEMFKTGKTLDELCEEFVEKAKNFYKNHEEETMIIDLEDLEGFFSYKASHYQSTWIPKEVRDKLRELGVKFRKQRGRTYVYVELIE